MYVCMYVCIYVYIRSALLLSLVAKTVWERFDDTSGIESSTIPEKVLDA